MFAVLALPGVAAAGYPLGSIIEESALVDVTDEGFDSLEDVASTLVPTDFAVPDFYFYQEGGCFDPCGFFGDCEVCTYSVELDASGLAVAPAVDDLTIVPAESVLNLSAALTAQLNSASDPGTLYYRATGIGIPISDTCGVYTKPVTVDVSGSIQLATALDLNGVDVDGDGVSDTKLLDATIPPLGWSWTADSDDIELDCTTGSLLNTLNDVLDFLGLENIYDLILQDLVEPQIDSLVDTLPATIEPVVEDTFSALFLNTTVDLLGVPVTLTLWPEEVEVHAEGARIAMASATGLEPNPCVAEWDTGESLSTPSNTPTLGSVPAGLGFTPHAAILADDDFINHVLYGAWAGGLLCLTLSEDNDPFGLPIPLTSALIGLLAQDAFDDLLPTAQPLEISTEPREPPVVGPPGGPHDLSVVADEIGLNFVTVVEGRKTRLIGVDLVADIGADLTFDSATGNLAAEIDLSDGAITPVVAYNEFRPESSKEIGSALDALLNTVVLPLAEPYLGGLAFPLPSLEGFGVSNLEMAAAGQNGDFVGAFVTTGAVPYTGAGCTDSGGCDTSNCSSGCSSGGSAVFLVGWPLLVALIRRRR